MKTLLTNFINEPSLSDATKTRVTNLIARLDAEDSANLMFAWNQKALAIDNPTLDDIVNNICQIMEDHLDGKSTNQTSSEVSP